jgi:preprotein translocase subunit YajC
MTMLVVIMALFYFMLIVPQNKEKKKREQMLTALKPGDRVLTTGGLWGTVAQVSAESDIVLLKVAENAKVEVSKAYILSVDVPAAEHKK